jgi:hypothetical protein
MRLQIQKGLINLIRTKINPRSVVHQIHIFRSGLPSTSVIKLLLRSRWLFVYNGNTHCKVRRKGSTQTL